MRTPSLVYTPRPNAKVLSKSALIVVALILSFFVILILNSLFTTPDPELNANKKFSILPLAQSQVLFPAPAFIQQLPDYQNAAQIDAMLNRHRSPVIIPPPWAIWLKKQLDTLEANQKIIESKLHS